MDDFTIYQYLNAGIAPASIRDALDKDDVRIINDFGEKNVPPRYKEIIQIEEALIEHYMMLQQRVLPYGLRSELVDKYWQLVWYEMGELGPDTPHIFSRAWIIGNSRKSLHAELLNLGIKLTLPDITTDETSIPAEEVKLTHTEKIRLKAESYVRQIANEQRHKRPEERITHNLIARKIMDDPQKRMNLQNKQGKNYSFEWLLKIAGEVTKKDYEDLFLNKNTKK